MCRCAEKLNDCIDSADSIFGELHREARVAFGTTVALCVSHVVVGSPVKEAAHPRSRRATMTRNFQTMLGLSFSLIAAALCYSQDRIVYGTPPQGLGKSWSPVYRTVITYDGSVCLATPTYDLMLNGQVIFKHQGMRYDGSGYFWSDAIHDQPMRQNHFEHRIVGTQNQYWPPIPTGNQRWPTTVKRLSVQPSGNAYFGPGSRSLRRGQIRSPSRVVSQIESAHLVRCPNGTYAITCQ